LIAGQGHLPVGWRIAARDYDETVYEADVYQRVVGNPYDGAIVEFHIDGPATATSTGRALPRIIDNLRNRGYRFVTIPQMAVACSAVATVTDGSLMTLAWPAYMSHEAVLLQGRMFGGLRRYRRASRRCGGRVRSSIRLCRRGQVRGPRNPCLPRSMFDVRDQPM
jgi:hypothetical protein